jgi:hypothetical protein
MLSSTTHQLDHAPHITITETTFAAQFTGRCGPTGRGEGYSGVTPGATGVAKRSTWSTGLESWSFSVGGAWLGCKRADIELT